MTITTHKLPDFLCPQCGYHMDVVGNADDETTPPVPGDTTVCLACGGMLLFEPDMSVRLVTEADIKSFTSAEVKELNKAIDTRKRAIERGLLDPEELIKRGGRT